MLRTVDLVLRFLYVAFVPFILLNAATIMPISGLLISSALATAVALFGSERWRARVANAPVGKKFLANMARVGDYYAERPPRPLFFYVFYPVLLPYVLINKSARAEFLLFRRLNIVALIIILATNSWEYFRHWYPDLAFSTFAGTVIGILILQMLVAAILVMPIVTTILMLHQRQNRRTLVALAMSAALLTTLGFISKHRKQNEQLPAWPAARLWARTKAHPSDSRHALEGALQAAIAYAGTHRPPAGASRDVIEELGRAMETAAVDSLDSFYLSDEAAGFHLFGDAGTLVIFAVQGRRKPIWLAHAKSGFVDDAAALPPGLRAALHLD